MERIPVFSEKSTRVALHDLVYEHFHWQDWEALIERHGITIDRPGRSRHPVYPEIIYPIDYGFINATLDTEGQEIDVFVGTARNGLVALLITTDYRKRDQEFKLIYNCTPLEIYLANGFINFNPGLMDGLLVMRHPMHTLWQ